jgi:hypothetical protein
MKNLELFMPYAHSDSPTNGFSSPPKTYRDVLFDFVGGPKRNALHGVIERQGRHSTSSKGNTVMIMATKDYFNKMAVVTSGAT